MNKHIKYAKYILRHKWFVAMECLSRGLYWRGLMHDMSKFTPTEWIAYVNYFYGEKPADYKGFHNPGQDIPFDTAWLTHIHKNPHHWQYWVLREDNGNTIPLPIPKQYLVEMVCDWIGAGKAQGFNSPKDDPNFEVRNWYIKNYNKMIIHEESRKNIEKLIS